jgi:hypothetical protein
VVGNTLNCFLFADPEQRTSYTAETDMAFKANAVQRPGRTGPNDHTDQFSPDPRAAMPFRMAVEKSEKYLGPRFDPSDG